MMLTDSEVSAIARASAAEMKKEVEALLKLKFELVLGIDCTDEEARAQMRKDMEWLRSFRGGVSGAATRLGYFVLACGAAAVLFLGGFDWRPFVHLFK